MHELKGKRVLILQQRSWGMNIGHFLAKKLQAEGCALGAITFKRTSHDFVLAQKDVAYDYILNNDEVMSDPKKFLDGRDVDLRVVCDDLGIDSVWPIVMSLRQHVRSYREKWYYAYRQNVSDEEIIYFVKAVYIYINDMFEKFRPDVIIGPNFVALPQIMLGLFAKSRGIRMLGVTDTKVKDYFMFSYSYRDDEGPLFKRIKEIAEGAVSPNREKARAYIAEFRREFKKPSYAVDTGKKESLYRRLRHQLAPYRAIWCWYAKPRRNVLKSTGITPDYRPPRIILRDFYSEKKYRKFAERFSYYPLEKIGKCVFFPLQFQPEASIDVIAPFFSNQLEMARLIAMALPADYTLIVKEHPAMVGMRTPSFYQKISRTPNVKLIDYRITSETAIKKADILMSINSTALSEASYYHKPAIQFGSLGTTLLLPNVFRHTDMSTLSEKIKEVITVDLRTDGYERRLEDFVTAVYDIGFNVDYYQAWLEGQGSKEDMDLLWETYKKEILTD